mmetsp:Transcript_27763/g.98936  ORF Transcript_27763/g.98936 Transcript_27763/m.98936 type:complete len:406 (+) Transcript_27763:36-1253(+)
MSPRSPSAPRNAGPRGLAQLLAARPALAAQNATTARRARPGETARRCQWAVTLDENRPERALAKKDWSGADPGSTAADGAQASRPAAARGSALPLSPLCDALELLEVRRERLGGASRVEDVDCNAGAGGERERHGDAVVIVRLNVDVGVRQARWRRDHAVLFELDNVSAELGRLSDDGLHALRLLDAPRGHAADRRRPVGYERHGGERHGGVGDVDAVDVDAAEARAVGPRDGDVRRLPDNRGTHLLQHAGEAHVALRRRRATANDGARAARHGCRGHEVRRRRRVALDKVAALGRGVLLTRCDGEDVHLRIVKVHGDAESLHEADCQLDIRSGDELVRDANLNRFRLRQQRRRDQQRGEELRRSLARDADDAAVDVGRDGPDLHGRAAAERAVERAVHVATELA